MRVNKNSLPCIPHMTVHYEYMLTVFAFYSLKIKYDLQDKFNFVQLTWSNCFVYKFYNTYNIKRLLGEEVNTIYWVF